MRRSATLAAALAAALAAGCHRAGPRAITAGRDNFNVAIQQTNNEQLLLNLVRLRYRDTPLFLEIASVTSNYVFEVGGRAEGGLATGPARSVGLSSSLTYAERPTVAYVPLQGQRFATQLLTPIDPHVILLMYHSGWAIDRIFKICVQRLGPLTNAARASGPTPERPPDHAAYFELTRHLRALWEAGHLDLGLLAVDRGDALVLRIDEAALARPEPARIAELLGLRGPQATLVLSDREAGGVPLVSRSVLAAMFYLSQGVEVPARDREAGRVTVTRAADGGEFAWSTITGGLMRIRHQARPPARAYVAVPYRDAWFYIDDADLDSKSTFALLGQLFELQSGEVKIAGPLLTLPVGGGS